MLPQPRFLSSKKVVAGKWETFNGALYASVEYKHPFHQEEIHSVIDEFFEELKDGLREGKAIELRGLGTFEVRVRKGKKKARNPKTGETVSAENHGVAVFRSGKDLKDSLWNIK